MIKPNCIKRLYENDYKSFTLGKNYKISYQDEYYIELLDNKGREITFYKKNEGVVFHYIGDYFYSNPVDKRFVIFEKTSVLFNFKEKDLTQ